MTAEEARFINFNVEFGKEIDGINSMVRKFANLGYHSTPQIEKMSAEVVDYFEKAGFTIDSTDGFYRLKW